MNNNKTNNSYRIFQAVAFVAALVASMATYDIAYRFTPDILVFDFNIRQVIAGLSALLVDGLYILLDGKLADMKTKAARSMTFRFLVLIWGIMASVNVMDAIINNTIDMTALGKAGVVVYVIKLIALFYLAYYTYIHYDDPDTKLIISQRDATEARTKGVNHFVEIYSKAYAQTGAQFVAMYLMAEYILEETGKHPRDILGDGWESKLSKMAGLKWDGEAAGPAGPQETAKSASNDPNDTGSDSQQQPRGVTGKFFDLLPDALKEKAGILQAQEAVPASKKGTAPGF